jgi:hypothetical protein
MFRTVAVAVAMCGATLATRAMACEAHRASEQEVCQSERINDPAAVAEFQGRISSGAAEHELAVQP